MFLVVKMKHLDIICFGWMKAVAKTKCLASK